MKRPQIIVIMAVIALVVLGGFITLGMKSKPGSDMPHMDMPKSSDSSATQAALKPNEVRIKDFAFGPDKITIKKGTTVTWTNQDSAHHDITPTAGAADFKASKLLAKGESYSFTFNTAGTYSYKCSPHPYMKAMVEVTE